MSGAFALCLIALAACVPAAQAARPATASERVQMLRAAAASSHGKLIGLRVTGRGRVTVAPFAYRTRASVTAARSSIDRSWALLVTAMSTRADARRTFLLKRRSGRWRVEMSASRGSEQAGLCRRARPGTEVALDLGLGDATWPGRCRHRRPRARLVRRMTAAELASVRAMVEWRFDDYTFEKVAGPVQPRVRESFVRTSDCAWDGRGSVIVPPYGQVSRADPRWGTVIVTCVTGWDGFALLESPSVILVSRSGEKGAFTAVPAHTMPSYSMLGELCTQDRRWPIPAAARVALAFCTPFPAELGYVLR
jgi:hypothetical protein